MNEKTYTVKLRGKTAATILFTYPDAGVPDHLSRFLANYSARKMNYAEKLLLRPANRQISAFANDYKPLSSQSSVQIMTETGSLISLFCDTFLDFGAEGTYMERDAFTFDKNGRQMSLKNLFVKPFKQVLIPILREQFLSFCRETGAGNTKNPQKAIQTAISRGDFYLTDDGIAVFFRQGSIASKIWGIPTFLAEYKKLDGLLDKRLL